MKSTIGIVGRETFESICRKYGLSVEGQGVTEELLGRWDKLVGDSNRKMQAVIELIVARSDREQILHCVMEMSLRLVELRAAKNSEN